MHEAKIAFGNAIIDADFSKIGGFLAGTRYLRSKPKCCSMVLDPMDRETGMYILDALVLYR